MQFLRHWWWVMFFCVGTCLFYCQSMRQKRLDFQRYSHLLAQKDQEKQMAYLEKEQLEMKIASQTDPAWIEMILMRDLGMVPDGYLKVHFKRS